ncbi:MAG: hypothetical protein WC314_09340 [Vulcanimicrobiota bacterium]
MSITFHPAKERPGIAAFLAFALGILAQALWQWLPAAPALVLWFALVLSLRDFFLPSTYRLNEEGLTVGRVLGSRYYPWSRFRAFVSDRNGLFLSPYRSRRATENQRGVFLAMRPLQREKAVEFCREMGLEKRPK